VFHVSLLEPKSKDLGSLRTTVAPSPPIVIDGTSEWVVKAIHDTRVHRRQRQYLVEWLGFPLSESSWEPVSNLTNCKDLLRLFNNSLVPQHVETPCPNGGSVTE
jgi:hypothetical protein